MRIRHVNTSGARGGAALLADVFLNPSLGESFGLTMLEALAHGADVVCSDLPVFREVAGADARFAAPGDASAWAAALDVVAASWPAAPRAGVAARLRERHALHRVAAEYERLYARALGLAPAAA